MIVAMALFPPWTHTINRGSYYVVRPAGYEFIGYTPTADEFIGYTPTADPKELSVDFSVKIDMTKLSFQILIVFALTGIGVLAFSRDVNDEEQPKL